ncbi:MAG: RNA polymerase sigma factor [Acidobacteriota bacterium]
MDERKAIRLCITHRDPAGFEFLVKTFRMEALYHAVSFLGNYEDAADACQDSFYRAFLAIPSLKKLDRFYPWFYVILKNNCLNRIRKQAHHVKKREEIYNSVIPPSFSGPEKILEQKEESGEIRDIISGLKSEHREILMMKYAMKKNYEDIAVTLGIPRGTVMSRLYYARRSFKEKYLEAKRNGASEVKNGGKNGTK